MELICPNCHSKDIGKIGINQYYCWNCFIELSVSNGMIHTHQVEEDGSLSSWMIYSRKKNVAIMHNIAPSSQTITRGSVVDGY